MRMSASIHDCVYNKQTCFYVVYDNIIFITIVLNKALDCTVVCTALAEQVLLEDVLTEFCISALE